MATGVLGERGRRVDQGLLVAALDERHRLVQLVQGLAQAGHVAVAEDAQGGGDQPAALAVGDGVLPGQVGHDRLGDGQSDGGAVVIVGLFLGSMVELDSRGQFGQWSVPYQGRPCRMTVFTSVISATAERRPSLPMPLPFSPP